MEMIQQIDLLKVGLHLVACKSRINADNGNRHEQIPRPENCRPMAKVHRVGGNHLWFVSGANRSH